MSSSGPSKGIQWLIRTDTGKQLGPYSTEAVLKLIGDGAFTGVEQIKRYPDGKWAAISRQPDFYDKLLEALEEVKKKPPQDRVKLNSETQVDVPPAKKPVDPSSYEETVALPHAVLQQKDKTKKRVIQQQDVNPTSIATRQTIDLTRVDTLARKEEMKSARLPILLGVIAVGLVIGALLLPDEQENVSDGKPNLISPRAGVEGNMTPAQIKEGIQKSVGSFVKDTFESYLDAENKLVAVIEGAPQNVDARGTLCLVYKELWPYVKQDARDLEAVNLMAKSTRSLDPVGINGVYCEVTKLMVTGKYKEARGIIDYALNQPALSTAPVLYGIKAELLYEERDTKSALLYAEKAKQLWPDWIKPQFDYAKYLIRTEQFSPGSQALQSVLIKVPQHKLAMIELGIVYYRGFRQIDEAFKTLASALTLKNRVPQLEEAKAYFYLALIAAEKKDNAKAKEYSQKAYQLNPGDKQIRDLVVRLGGETKVSGKSAKNNELVFLGDQHFRTGNCLAAQAEYKAAFELDSTNAVAAMKAGKCLQQLNQTQEAISWLAKAMKADPSLVTAYVLMADYQSSRYDYNAAMQTLNRASSKFKNNHEVLRGLGLIEFRRNNMKDAISFLQRASKIFENDVETLILLAQATGASGDFQSAQKYAVRAIEIDATNNEAQITYAKVLSQFQGVDVGALYLKDLISRFSYTIEFRLALAEMYRTAERHRQSQQIYEQILDAEPRNKSARLGIGAAYQAQGLVDRALKEYLNATVVDPSDPEGLFKAGILYLEIGKNNEAVTQFRRALAVNPLYPRLNYYIGRAYFLNGQIDEALKAAGDERKINPNLADSYILAAEVYASTKNFQMCAQEYQQAAKLRPQGAEIYTKLARCYRQAGSPDIAESMLKIAASQESGLPEIYREQGAIYEVKGDTRAAAQAYNKYLTLSPNAPDKKEIESRILSLGK